MLYLKRLNFFVSVLQQTGRQSAGTRSEQDAGEQMSRLYNDALIGLFSLGVIPEQTENGLAYLIDGECFPVPAAVKKIMDRMTAKQGVFPTGRVVEKTVENSQKKEETAEMDQGEAKTPAAPVVSETADKKTVRTDPGPDIPTASNTRAHEPQAIVDRHIIKVSNKKNPSDVKEFTITVIPLGVKENATATDIAVEIEHNGQFVYFVSEQKRKSIMAEIDGVPFNIRGQWLNFQFKSIPYLGSALKATHTLSDKVKKIGPDEVIPKYYRDDFVREVGNSILHILPFSRMNEPGSGQCKTIVVQETDGDRQIYCDNEKNVLMMYLDGMTFRVYGKWTPDKSFQTTVEQTD